MEKKREFDPIKGQFPGDGIVCFKCPYRDKTVVEIGGKTEEVGPKKSWCEMYNKQNSNGKPMGILFHGERCGYFPLEVKDGKIHL